MFNCCFFRIYGISINGISKTGITKTGISKIQFLTFN